jgi:hypothetical protein
MRADSALGIITVFMAVLGGLVSAHAPTKLRHKISYAILFLVAGAASVVLVVKISNENVSASKGLTDALDRLKDSTNEISRMTALNTQLQAKLLDSSKSIAELSKENLEQITGAKGYCYVFPIIHPADAPAFPLTVMNGTNYSVFDVTIDVTPQIVAGDKQEQIAEKLNKTVSVFLGNVSPHYARQIGVMIPVRKDIDNRFHVSLFSRSSIFSEVLVVSWNNGYWHTDWELSRQGDKKRIHEIAGDYPYLQKQN